MSDVMRQLAKPFPDKYVHTNPSGGGSYIKHHVIEQRLIQVLGLPPSFEKVEVIYGDVAAIPANPNGKSQRAKEGRPALKGVIVAVVCRMTVKIGGGLSFSGGITTSSDPQEVVVEEAGDCEQPHNWDTDGQRLKDAMSDAYKRCAMRLGCGLHLWSQDEYFLYDQLTSSSDGANPASTPTQASGSAPSESSKAKSSPEEPQAVPAEPASASPSPASSPRSSGEVDADVTGARGSGSEGDPAEASSDANVYELVATAMADKKLSTKVMTTANRVALEMDAIPEKGISRQTVMDLPEEVLAAIAQRMNLKQEAMV